MKDTVTLKELFAIVVRRGKLVLTLALVFALLMGAVQTYRQVSASMKEENSPEKIEERYQDALEQFGKDKENLEKQLEKAKWRLESQQEYNENSLLLRLDPHSKYVTSINLAVTDVEEGAFQQVFRLEATPIDYLVSKIQSQYMVYWNSLDLETALKNCSYAGTPDKYLREMVTLSRMDGGGLTLTAFGEGGSDSRQLAESAYACLREGQTIISAASYEHTFSVLSQVTKDLVDEGLASTQETNLSNVESYETNIEDLTKRLEELEEPERETGYAVSSMLKSIVHWVILGIALGVVFAMVWTLTSYLFRSRPETSRQLEEGLSIPFLGSMAKPGCFWNRLADGILNERLWENEDQALEYISASAKALLPVSGAVLLASTLSLEMEQVQPVMKVLESQGHTVRFIGEALRSPEMAEALKDCGCVVLAERPGITRWDDVAELASLSQKLERPVGGFVTV